MAEYKRLKEKQDAYFLSCLNGWMSRKQLGKKTVYSYDTIVKILRRLQNKGLVKQHTIRVTGRLGRVHKVTLYHKR